MGFGLFGKLPQKRDFMSVNLPHAVLNPFETWLQSAVAASRNEIGRNWENYYLVAPIWRFWLGKDVLGTACTGSLMPSVDQVGRYFPLAIMYWAEPGETLTPPLINPIDGWYAPDRSADARDAVGPAVRGRRKSCRGWCRRTIRAPPPAAAPARCPIAPPAESSAPIAAPFAARARARAATRPTLPHDVAEEAAPDTRVPDAR